MPTRKPLSPTELKILKDSRALVANCVQQLGGFERAGTEWGVDRKALAAYAEQRRAQNSRFGRKMLALIPTLSDVGQSEGDIVSRETPAGPIAGASEARGVRYAAEAMAETLHRLLREARLAEGGDSAEPPMRKPVRPPVRPLTTVSTASAKKRKRGGG